jgi:hypothetical protein
MDRTVIEYVKEYVHKGRIIKESTLFSIAIKIKSISIPANKQDLTDQEIDLLNQFAVQKRIKEQFAVDEIREENAMDNEDYEDPPDEQ